MGTKNKVSDHNRADSWNRGNNLVEAEIWVLQGVSEDIADS